jgi:hypothetical protein
LTGSWHKLRKVTWNNCLVKFVKSQKIFSVFVPSSKKKLCWSTFQMLVDTDFVHFFKMGSSTYMIEKNLLKFTCFYLRSLLLCISYDLFRYFSIFNK